MRVKVISDGRPNGTKIFTEKGDDISAMVRAVSFVHEPDDIPRCELELIFSTAYIDGRAIMYGPRGKPVRRIEYEDGEVEEFLNEQPVSKSSRRSGNG